MTTLLIRLAAPMQSWGDESKYNIRQTRTEPGKSGVIGLISAAMGLSRDSERINELAQKIRYGVRVDQCGKVLSDFHTARAPKYTANGDVRYDTDGKPLMEDSPNVTYRYYLHDACFVAGLESEDSELIDEIANALNNPVFPLFLGRRSCPPTLPVLLGKRELDLEHALSEEPWHAAEWYMKREKSAKLRIVLESPKGVQAWHSIHDQPVSFSSVHRIYAYRGLEKERVVQVGMLSHDPMSEL